MFMKINRYNSPIQNMDIYKDNMKNKPVESDKAVGSGVNIQISNSAKELVEKINQSNNVEFSERVEKIRQSIIDGKYKVNSEDIAGKIIQAMKDQEDVVK